MSIHDKDRRLVKERLAAEGIVYRDLHALLEERETLVHAAPLLMDLLAEIKSPIVKTDLVRVASSVAISPRPLVEELRRLRPELERDAKPSESLARLSPRELAKELARIRSESSGVAGLAWTIGEALAETADISIFADLAELLKDKSLGRAREMLPYALVRIQARRQEAIRVLLEVLDDEDVTSQALDALAKVKAVEAIPSIRRHLESSNRLVRSEAKKALQKLEKAARKSSADVSDPSPLHPREEELVETSANFDLEEVPLLLAQVAQMVEGLGPSELKRIEARLLEMELDEEQGFDFRVRYRGEETLVKIRIYMSDVNAPNVAFFSSPGLAGVIDRLIDDLD